MSTTTDPWGDEDAAALRRARGLAGQKWHECVRAIAAFGGAEVSQGTFSKWENGKSAPKLPESVVAVRAYCAEVRSRGWRGAGQHRRRRPVLTHRRVHPW